MQRFLLRRLWLALVPLWLLPPIASAQSWPMRPVRLIAPFPPGGPIDMLARTVAAMVCTASGDLRSTFTAASRAFTTVDHSGCTCSGAVAATERQASNIELMSELVSTSAPWRRVRWECTLEQ